MNKLQIMLALQDRMNSRVNPDWIKAGNQWMRAIVVEGAEALEHLGWKWWKKQQPDQKQFNIELVDVWHFILSAAIERWGVDAAEQLNSDSCKERFVADPYDQTTEWDLYDVLDHEGRLNAVEVLVGLAAMRAPLHHIVSVFRAVQAAANMSDADLYNGYLAKNVLNFFRQDHGYKEGTYFKTWFGEEDNVVLERIVSELPEVTEVTVYNALKDSYMKVLAAEAAKAAVADDTSFALAG